MVYQQAHEKLFGKGVIGALGAVRRPVPTRAEYPDDCAKEYVEIAAKNIQNTSKMRNGWPSLIVQGLRLLVLERIFKSRNIPWPPHAHTALVEVKRSSEIAATVARLG